MNPTILLPIAELLAKSVLLLGGALLLIASLRRSSAARRHAILLAAFVALLLLPLGKFAAPYWRLYAFAPARPQSMQFTDMVATTDSVTAFEPATPAVQPAHFTWPSPTQWLLGAWGAGAVLLLGFRAFGSWQIDWLRRHRTTPADDRVAALVQAVTHELGCAARHEVRISPATRVPCTWGLLRACVLLPAAAAQWSEAHLVAALRHEFAHIARRDYLARWLSTTVCALYWPNPLVWFAARKLHALQEQACDDLVLRAGTPSADYATLLVETARACVGGPLGCREAIAMARPSTLQNRVVAVVDETRDRRPAGHIVKLLGALGTAGAVGVSALAQVAGEKLDAPAGNIAQPAPAQVEISAKFIEVAKDKFSMAQVAEGVEVLKKNVNNFPGGLDLLSAPRVTTRSGQRALIQIGEEQPLPPGAEPKTQFVGTSLEVLPTVADGKIQLQCAVELVARSGVDAATQQPIFNHRKTTTTFDLASGSKAIIPSIPSDKEGREIFVLIEAKVLPPPATKLDPPKGADAGSPINAIDQLLIENLDEKPTAPGQPTATAEKPAELLRRSYLDIVGRAPTAEEMKAFLRECEAVSVGRYAEALGEKPEAAGPGAFRDDLAGRAVRAAHRALGQPIESGTKPDPKAGQPSLSLDGAAPEPKPLPANPTLEKAKKIVLPAFDLRNASVGEAFEHLRTAAVESDPEKQGVPMVLKLGLDDPRLRITVALKDIPVSEAFLYLANLANYRVRFANDGVLLEPPAPEPKLVPLTPTVDSIAALSLTPVDILADDTHVSNGVAIAEGHVRFKYGATAITADHLNYSPDHRAEFRGNVEIKTEGGIMRGDNISVELGPDGRIFVGKPAAKEADFTPLAPVAK